MELTINVAGLPELTSALNNLAAALQTHAAVGTAAKPAKKEKAEVVAAVQAVIAPEETIKQPTVAELRELCNQVVAKHGDAVALPKIRATMEEFGVKFAKDVPENQRIYCANLLKELL